MKEQFVHNVLSSFGSIIVVDFMSLVGSHHQTEVAGLETDPKKISCFHLIDS